jgi:hypothetical protein
MEYSADIKIKNSFQKLEKIESNINSDSSLAELNKYNMALEDFYNTLIDLSIQKSDKKDIEDVENPDVYEPVDSEIGPPQWLQLLSDVKNKLTQLSKKINSFVEEDKD